MNRILCVLCILGMVIFLDVTCYSNVPFGGNTFRKSKQEIQRDSQLEVIYSEIRVQSESINRQTRKTEDSIKQILIINEKERLGRVNFGIIVSVLLFTIVSIVLMYRNRLKVVSFLNKKIYLILKVGLMFWIFIHSVFYLIGKTYKSSKTKFWFLTDGINGLDFYDLSEFIFYSGLPFLYLIYLGFKFFSKNLSQTK